MMNSSNQDTNRICPVCKMPAYYHTKDQAYYGPWISDELDLDTLKCQNCGWIGTWEEVDYELV